MRCHRLYGLTLQSDFLFTHPLSGPDPGRGPGSADLVFELVDNARLPGEDRPGEPEPGAETVYRSPERLTGGESVLTAVRAGAWTLLRFADTGAFAVGPDRIVARPDGGLDPARRTLLELRLLGPVLAFWLERSGRVALHAAAVTVEGRAAVFLSSNHGGKTSLAAALLRQGRPLLTDDVLALEEAFEETAGGETDGAVDGSIDGFRAHPGYPQVRLWPADVGRFLARDPGASFPRVHPGFDKVRVPVGEGGLGSFDGTARPPGCIYLPDRGGRSAEDPGADGIEITDISRRDAVLALLRHSFLPRLVAAMGWQERRLEQLARVATAVPVRRLTYPSGHEHLPAVAEAIVEDLREQPGS